MAKDGNSPTAPFFQELFQLGIYKRSQGRVARQVTFIVLAMVVLLGCMALYGTLIEELSSLALYGVSGGVLLVGWWVSFRVVNYSRFADFLIAVETEMIKVSWPSWVELYRSSLVVLGMMFSLSAILFFFDAFWNFLLFDLPAWISKSGG